MNFSQLQDRLRVELQRRIERGTLSVSLLARQTGLGQGHISNFLHARRSLSQPTLDKILAAQHLTVADLMPAARGGARGDLLSGQLGEVVQVPLVSHAVALFEPYIRVSSVQSMLSFPASELGSLRARCTATRRQWERLVAIRISAADALPMQPVVQPNALVILDRHYNSFAAYQSHLPNLYGVRSGNQLLLRYADFLANRVVIRALRPETAPEVLEVNSGEGANDLLIGRVATIWNAM